MAILTNLQVLALTSYNYAKLLKGRVPQTVMNIIIPFALAIIIKIHFTKENPVSGAKKLPKKSIQLQ